MGRLLDLFSIEFRSGNFKVKNVVFSAWAIGNWIVVTDSLQFYLIQSKVDHIRWNWQRPLLLRQTKKKLAKNKQLTKNKKF